jgi:hypothetical protein
MIAEHVARLGEVRNAFMNLFVKLEVNMPFDTQT